MNRPARFTAADLRRATKIALETGHEIEIAPDGTIRLVRRRANDRGDAKPVEPVEEVVF